MNRRFPAAFPKNENLKTPENLDAEMKFSQSKYQYQRKDAVRGWQRR